MKVPFYKKIEKFKLKVDLFTASEGKVEGKAEGKIEGKIEVAKMLKQQGIAIEVIAVTTGLTKDEINKLSLKKV